MATFTSAWLDFDNHSRLSFGHLELGNDGVWRAFPERPPDPTPPGPTLQERLEEVMRAPHMTGRELWDWHDTRRGRL